LQKLTKKPVITPQRRAILDYFDGLEPDQKVLAGDVASALKMMIGNARTALNSMAKVGLLRTKLTFGTVECGVFHDAGRHVSKLRVYWRER
jgi:hypothetical protein